MNLIQAMKLINKKKKVNEMKAIGEELLNNLSNSKKRRFGFHVPPHISVNHLHLHCMSGSFKLKTKLTHNVNFPHRFISPSILLNILSNKF